MSLSIVVAVDVAIPIVSFIASTKLVDDNTT